MFRAIIITLSALLLAQPASAQVLAGQFNDWALFTSKEAGKKVCYITSNPVKKNGNYKVRGDVYMIATYRGSGSTPEISIDTGFDYKIGSEPEFIIDGRKVFKLFTSAQTPQMAWAKDEQTDRVIIDSLKRGGRVMVKSISFKGTNAQDVYSLKGFTGAYNKMIAACQ